MDNFRLDKKVALVTGIKGLLGPVFARALLEAGAKVAGIDLSGAKTSKRFDQLKADFDKKRFRVYSVDILDRAKLKQALADIKKDFGSPTILINNAGIDQPPSNHAKSYLLEDVPLKDSRKILEVNTLGAFQVMQVLAKEMKQASQEGSIINIGSLYASVSPDPEFYKHIESNPPFLKPPMYGASKAALLRLTGFCATYWGPFGIRVNAISPGGVFNNQDQKFIAKFSARVPLKGRLAYDNDLAGAVVFLASDASRYITGQNLQVDGGFTTL